MNFTLKNKILYILGVTFRAVALLCSSGTLIQTFIEVLGFDSSFNYLHTSVLQIVNILVILLCSRFADKDSILKRAAFIQLPVAVLFLMYIPLCFTGNASTADFITLLCAGILQSVFCALYTVCDYKMPYHLFMPEEFGVVISAIGIVSSVASLSFSAAISFYSSIYDYKTVMFCVFIISAVLMVMSGISFYFLKSIICRPDTGNAVKTKKTPLKQIFSHPVFYKLLIPNLMRGFAMGATTVFTILAFTLGYDAHTTTLMVTIQSAASLIGYFIFGFCSKHFKTNKIILFSGLTFLLLPFMLTQNSTVFLAIFSIVLCGRIVADCAVPAALLRAVPVEIAGPYNAWRMILHTAGMLVATSLATIMSPMLLIILTTVFQLLFTFFYVTTKELKDY